MNIALILLRYLQDFDSIEMTVRRHVVDTVAPDISSFFCKIVRVPPLEKPEP